MLKYFEDSRSCYIILNYPLVQEDTLSLRRLFLEKKYDNYTLEFGRIYSIDAELLNLLYREMKINKVKIEIITHKNRLNRYFHQLDISSRFESIISKDVKKIEDMEVFLIGGSADSSPKIINILKKIDIKNIIVVIIQHIDAHTTNHFDEILHQYTSLNVCYAKDNETLKKGAIYLAPADKHFKVNAGLVQLNDDEKYNFSRPSISISYESFSNYYKEKLVVLQECGYASDGVDKLNLVVANKSTLLIQSADECEAKSMVENAANTEFYDYIFKEEDISRYINFRTLNYSKNEWLTYLLDEIFSKYKYNFKTYKKDLLLRRFNVFMIKHSIMTVKEAVGVILFNKSAFKGFFLELSINVSELFRNPNSFNTFSKFLQETYSKRTRIKLWSAGCSSGEEVYSILILLDNLKMLNKSTLYATDFNGVILEEAKNAIYSIPMYLKALANYKAIGLKNDLDSYLSKNLNFVTINENIRKKANFFQHNLLIDGSFNEFDIIICKNVIIYFDEESLVKAFELFYDSLKVGGYLILGESEVVHSKFMDKFAIYNLDSKVFKKVK